MPRGHTSADSSGSSPVGSDQHRNSLVHQNDATTSLGRDEKQLLPTSESDASNGESSELADGDSNAMDVDEPAWKGWAELENDPVGSSIIFTSILRAWGVQDVQVEEVIPLDAVLEKDPSSVLGLVFLSRWTPSEGPAEATHSAANLWFANQISTFSCATLALMNIINNRDDVRLGEELRTFKAKTLTLTPKERGLELDDFQFVKDIHNSFSRELDRMHVDLRLKEEVQAFARKSKKPRKKFTKRKKRRQVDDDEENGFHFVAYVPAQDHVWKLDGMESRPRDMGTIESGGTWLFKIIADLQVILEASEANGMEFSLLSLCHDPDKGQSAVDDLQIARIKEDWSPFIAHMLRLHAERGDLESLLI